MSEREMARDGAWRFPVLAGEHRTHRADLGVIVEGARVVVEVELTAKAPARLYAILAGYERQLQAGGLDGVAYVCDDDRVSRAVERAARQVGLGDHVFRLFALSQIVTDVRDLAAPPVSAREPRLIGVR